MQIFLYSLLSFFSIFGLLAFMFFIIDFILEIQYLKGKTIYTVVLVENEPCVVPGILRALLLKLYKNDTGISDNKIILIDGDEQENNYDSVKEKYRDLVFILKKEELAKKVENF